MIITRIKNGLSELPSRGRTGRVAAALGTGTVTWLINTAVIIAVTPVFLAQLGADGYGVWLFVLSTVALLGLGDIRVGTAIIPYAIRYLAADDKTSLHELYSAAFFLRAIMSLLLILTAIGMGQWLLELGDLDPNDFEPALHTLWLMASAVAIRWIGSVYESLVISCQAEYRLIWANLARAILAPLIGAVLVFHFDDIRALGWSHLIAIILALSLQFREYRRQYPSLGAIPSMPRWAMFTRIGSLSIWFALDGLAAAAFMNADKVIIQNRLGSEQVASYAITWFLYFTMYQAISRIAGVVTVGVGDVLAKKPDGSGASVLTTLYSVISMVSFSIIPIAASVSPVFVSLWAGKELYAGHATSVAMSLILLQMAFSYPSIIILTATGRIKSKVIISVIGGVLAISIGYMLAPRLGLLGVAAGNCVAMLVTLTWFLPLTASRQAAPIEISWCVVSKVAVTSLIVGLCAAGILLLAVALDVPRILILALSAALTFFAVLLSLRLSPKIIRDALRTRFRQLHQTRK